MKFIKNFCRLVVEEELNNEQVMEYFDIVQSIMPTKVVTAYSDDGDKISADVMVYSAENDSEYIYEIVLDDQVDLDEGEKISDELGEVFPEINFEFETSLEI